MVQLDLEEERDLLENLAKMVLLEVMAPRVRPVFLVKRDLQAHLWSSLLEELSQVLKGLLVTPVTKAHKVMPVRLVRILQSFFLV